MSDETTQGGGRPPESIPFSIETMEKLQQAVDEILEVYGDGVVGVELHLRPLNSDSQIILINKITLKYINTMDIPIN